MQILLILREQISDHIWIDFIQHEYNALRYIVCKHDTSGFLRNRVLFVSTVATSQKTDDLVVYHCR